MRALIFSWIASALSFICLLCSVLFPSVIFLVIFGLALGIIALILFRHGKSHFTEWSLKTISPFVAALLATGASSIGTLAVILIMVSNLFLQ